jgi:hypothetical protein
MIIHRAVNLIKRVNLLLTLRRNKLERFVGLFGQVQCLQDPMLKKTFYGNNFEIISLSVFTYKLLQPIVTFATKPSSLP